MKLLMNSTWKGFSWRKWILTRCYFYKRNIYLIIYLNCGSKDPEGLVEMVFGAREDHTSIYTSYTGIQGSASVELWHLRGPSVILTFKVPRTSDLVEKSDKKKCLFLSILRQNPCYNRCQYRGLYVFIWRVKAMTYFINPLVKSPKSWCKAFCVKRAFAFSPTKLHPTF